MPKGVYIRTEKHSKINSKAHIGIPNNQKGLKRSDESRKKMSDAQYRFFSTHDSPNKNRRFSECEDCHNLTKGKPKLCDAKSAEMKLRK